MSNSKFTPETVQKIISSVRLGLTYMRAAQLAGISHKTLNDWVNRGKASESEQYVKFYEDLQKANAECEVRHAGSLAEASRYDWRASAWVLERRFARDWGRHLDGDQAWQEQLIAAGYQPEEIMNEAMEYIISQHPELAGILSGSGDEDSDE